MIERAGQMRRVPVYRKEAVKFALTCAIIVGSMAFAANSALAAEYTIDNADQPSLWQPQIEGSIFNTNYYQNGNILNVANDITIGDDLPSISGITDLTIRGNEGSIYTTISGDSSNYGYQLSNGASLTIQNLNFNKFAKDDNSIIGTSNLMGAALYVMDSNSSVVTHNVSYSNSSLTGDSTVGLTVNLWGGAVANKGNLEMNGGTISDSNIAAESGVIAASGTANGGAVYNEGTMSITEMTISDNSASAKTTSLNKNTSALGGAIYNSGSLTLSGTNITGNSAEITGSSGGTALGGGIYTTSNITLAGGNSFSGNTDQNGNNDIYLANNSNLLVKGSDSSTNDTISGGLASANSNSSIQVSDKGKLLLEGNNSRFSGNATVKGEGSRLTYSGTFDNSVINGTTTLTEKGEVAFDTTNNNNYNLNLADEKITSADNSGIFVKTGDGTLTLTGDNSGFTGGVKVEKGTLSYSEGGYINATSNQISQDATLDFRNVNAETLSNISGEGNLTKSAAGMLTISGDNSGFNGQFNLNEGSVTVDMNSDTDKFFNSTNSVNAGTELIFDVAEGVTTGTIDGSDFTSFDGHLVKNGEGTLQITGDWYAGSGRDNNVATFVNGGKLEFVANDTAGDADKMLSGDINISDGAAFKVDNKSTNTTFELNNNLNGADGATLEIAGEQGSLVTVSGADNSGFTGETLITSGNLGFTKSNSNSFVAGRVNIANKDSKLIYSTNIQSDGKISFLSGVGTLDKQGSGNLTVNMDNFTGTADVNGGTLTVNADTQKQDADGQFAFSAEVAGGSTLNYSASTDDIYNINSQSAFKFDNNSSNGRINFTNGTYNISSDLANAASNTTSFNTASVNIGNGENDVTLNGNYTLDNSTLSLANGGITTTTIANLTTTNTNNLNLDFDFTDGFDKLTANSGNAQVALTDSSIKALNMDNDTGLLVSETYDVLDGITFANNYSGVLSSNIYQYTVSTVAGSDTITLTASGYVGNTLYTLNHETSGERTFHLAGADNQYYIGQDLKQTLAGTLNIKGRTNDRADTINGRTDASSTATGLSMFEVVNDTTLNIDDITIQNAASSDRGGAVIYQSNENSTVNITNSTIQNNSAANGGAIYVTGGETNLSNVTLASNSATGNGGALSVSGGEMKLEGSTLASNSAVNGGAVYADGGTVDIDDVIFSANSATLGGAVYNDTNSKNLTLDNVTFSNNTATNGSAIYNLGSATVTDAVFSDNSANYIYNAQGGQLTITSNSDYTLQNSNTTDSVITNNGSLNLTSAANHSLTVADVITGQGGAVNTRGNVIFDNLVSDSTVNVNSGILTINGDSSDSYALDSVGLNIASGTTVNLNNHNINSGNIVVADNSSFIINNTNDITISSRLAGATTGSGTIIKDGTGKVSLTGANDNSEFVGNLSIFNGTVSFEKTADNSFFGANAHVTVNGANDGADSPSTFEYTDTNGTYFDKDFANVDLLNGGTLSISGNGLSTTHNIDTDWLTSRGTAANNIIFSSANYILHTNALTNRTDIKDNIIFNSSNVTLYESLPGTAITGHDEGAKEYDFTSNNYTFNNSVLDLSNRIAGDNYIFNELNFNNAADGSHSGLGLDVNLVLDEKNNIRPYADTITANSGSGIVDITKLFITDDNGIFRTESDGSLSKGQILVFKGNNNLKVAETNNAEILSWATNIYEYGVKSAQTNREADSIEIEPQGVSSTDTLRDLNQYQGNRGFSFIVINNEKDKNNYNIYRDLDTTAKGNFTVVGALVDEEKSILSGQLKPLQLLKDDDSLKKDEKGNWTYKGESIAAPKEIQIENPDGTIEDGYEIDISNFTPNEQTNGSMFELVNATNLEMSNVSVQDAKRYADEKSGIQDGSAIYAKNQNATVKLTNVDFVNNEVRAGNGGAIANIESKEFTIDTSVISGNMASANGGAIYNTSEGMTIKYATVSDNQSKEGLGGAIYTSADMTIEDSIFGLDAVSGETVLNTHKNGQQNDIYLAGTANVDFVTTKENENLINSGIAGEEGTTFTKSGVGTLNLNGSNSGFNGTLDVTAGKLAYTADSTDDTFVTGGVKVNKNAVLDMTIDNSENVVTQTLQNVAAGKDGSGTVIKNGAGQLNLAGDNSGFGGITQINSGTLYYLADSTTDKYLGGSTELTAEGTSLIFDISRDSSSDTSKQTASNISGVEGSIVQKSGGGELVLSGDNSDFKGSAKINAGTLTYKADSNDNKYFSGATTIASEASLVADVAAKDSENADITGQTIGNITGNSANFVKKGDGKIQLVGNNEFSGTTTIEQGILAYTSGNGNYVSGNTVINADGTLEYTVGTGDYNLTAISGEGTLSKLGGGNLNLVGNNSQFTGSVMIGDGRLSYTSADNNNFINADSYAIAQGAELYIKNSTSDDVNVSNLTAYIDEEGRDLGSGSVIKDGEGTLTLGGDNSRFKGALNINSGNVTFTKDNNTSYIAGKTDINSGAKLNYNVADGIEDTLANVSGSGILNKGGDAVLTFDANDNAVETSFTANANQGTLNIIGDSTTAFDFNMIANNSAILNYTSAINSNLTVGPNSVVGFGNGASNAQINFNSQTGGTYTLEGDLANYTGNQVSFDSSTIKLADSDYTYNGNYIIKDSVIDLTENGTNTTTFANLTTSDSKIKIDVDLTLPDPTSDKLVSKGGNGGALELALKDINLNDQKTDNGLGESYNINVLGGNLTLDNDDSLDFWATSAYEYRVTIAKGEQDIILTAIKASNEKSLKAMNNQSGDRGFQFHADDPDPYIIGESLGTTASGSFVVKGEANGNTVISGNNTKSFFEVTQDDTVLTVKDLTIQDAHSDNGGSVVIANNGSSTVNLDNVNITSSSSNGKGGVINNTNSESFIINNSEITNNTSNGLGGAIYTADDMTIIDTDFSGNRDANGKNDIYAAGEDTVVNIVSANKDVSVSSGLAGNGTVNKSGNNDLNLSGKNDDFTGNLNIADGDMNYTQSSSSDTYILGNTNIGSGNTVTITNNRSDITTGSFSGSGTLNKNGSNDMTLTGDNSNFTGTANINSGSVIFNSDNTKYISGTTNINQNGTLVVNADNNASLSKINGTGTVDKNGSGALVFRGNNNFNGSLNVNEGVFAMAAGATLGNLSDAQFAAGTGINLQNTSVVDLGNGSYSTDPSPASIENLYFDSLTLLGDVDLDIDIDLKNEIADKVGAGRVYGNGNLILDQDSLNVVSDALLNNTSVQVAYGDLANHVALDQGVTTVMGPIQKYNVAYNNGNLLFARQGGTTPDIGSVNPAVMASSVATQLGGYLTQLQTLNSGFYHMDRYTKYPYMMRLTAENTNRYAINDIPAYRRSSLPETSNAMWIQPYTTFEQVNLRGGLGVSNVAYGAMYGGDSNLVDIGHGFKGVLSTFVGYNGSHMSFNGVSMNQQGGALGVTGTLYKGNFFTGLTVSAGASAGDAFTQYGTDHFAMLTAGVASKTGYNWEMKDGKFIVQPSLFLGYTFANTFDYTNAAGVRIDSDPLHAITIAPGVKFIANLKNGWQPYLGVNMVWSIMDKTDVIAQDVRLPQLSVKPYVEYGVGVQKSWGERFTAFFQTMIRNGGRTGIVLTAGFRWALGKEPNYDNQKVQGTTQRKVIKSL